MIVAEQISRLVSVPSAGVDAATENSCEQTTSNDQALLESIRAGEEGALAKLYDSYSRLVFSVALRVLRDPSKAEDVLQDVFLKIWRHPESFLETHGKLGPWLAIVARNRAIDVLRRRTDESCEEMQLLAPDNVMKSIENSLLLQKVQQAIRLLPKEQRRALDLAFFRGMTHAEIVSLTGLPLGTVKTRIRTALLFLGKTLRSSNAVAAASTTRI